MSSASSASAPLQSQYPDWRWLAGLGAGITNAPSGTVLTSGGPGQPWSPHVPLSQQTSIALNDLNDATTVPVAGHVLTFVGPPGASNAWQSAALPPIPSASTDINAGLRKTLFKYRDATSAVVSPAAGEVVFLDAGNTNVGFEGVYTKLRHSKTDVNGASNLWSTFIDTTYQYVFDVTGQYDSLAVSNLDRIGQVETVAGSAIIDGGTYIELACSQQSAPIGVMKDEDVVCLEDSKLDPNRIAVINDQLKFSSIIEKSVPVNVAVAAQQTFYNVPAQTAFVDKQGCSYLTAGAGIWTFNAGMPGNRDVMVTISGSMFADVQDWQLEAALFVNGVEDTGASFVSFSRNSVTRAETCGSATFARSFSASDTFEIRVRTTEVLSTVTQITIERFNVSFVEYFN